MGRLCYPTTAPPRICPDRPENCPGARRVRRGFCHLGTKFDRRYACRGTSFISETNLSRCNKCYKRALAQFRGTSMIGARKLSRCRIYIAGRCGCPGAGFGRICHGSRVCKNHDEPINYTVRVIVRYYLILFFITVTMNIITPIKIIIGPDINPLNMSGQC